MGIATSDGRWLRVVIGGRYVSRMVTAGKVIYQAVRSCFGAGYWQGTKPWIGKDGWKRI